MHKTRERMQVELKKMSLKFGVKILSLAALRRYKQEMLWMLWLSCTLNYSVGFFFWGGGGL
uniref:Uncharacterized protein n=1 Tax=Oryza glumipatula TaxID=40148 RepID=A0A0D9ZEQ3_9ORYZ